MKGTSARGAMFAGTWKKKFANRNGHARAIKKVFAGRTLVEDASRSMSGTACEGLLANIAKGVIVLGRRGRDVRGGVCSISLYDIFLELILS